MELIIKPTSAEIIYYLVFKEPLLSVVEKSRIPLIKKFLKSFDLRLNDIKFNAEKPSNNFLSFFKFYDTTYFDVAFGLEEITAKISRPIDESQIPQLFGKLYSIIKDNDIVRQRINTTLHYSTEGDLTEYLDTLNPIIPEDFRESLSGKGVIYALKDSENQLDVHLVLSHSIIVPNGIYLNIEFNFSPNVFDFKSAYKIAKEKYESFLEVFNLRIKENKK